MTNNFKRTDRIAEMMQRNLAQLIQQNVKDPRLPGFVTISAVKVTADLAYAKVYFTVLDENKELVTSILNSAASYLRTALAGTMKLRTVPKLTFVYDESIEYGRRLSRLIDEANQSSTNESSDDKDV